MENQSLIELIKKNKVATVLIVLILVFLATDAFILRPRRRAQELEKQGVKVSGRQSTSSAATTTVASSASSKITPPEPLSEPVWGALKIEQVNDRIQGRKRYPFLDGRNIFKAIEKPVIVVDVPKIAVEEVIAQPDISYHGFFTVGTDKVAILRKEDEVLLTKLGTKVKRTSYRLASITPEKVVVTDLSNKLKDYEISLADETESN